MMDTAALFNGLQQTPISLLPQSPKASTSPPKVRSRSRRNSIEEEPRFTRPYSTRSARSLRDVDLTPELYSLRIIALSAELPKLKLLTQSKCRHPDSGRVSVYPPGADQGHVKSWVMRDWNPTFDDFSYETRRRWAAQRTNRKGQGSDGTIILVEDISHDLINLLGATFHINPEFFADHLDQSGFDASDSKKDLTASGQGKTLPSIKSHASFDWYRPVLPLFPVTATFREKLLDQEKPKAKCPFPGCVAGRHGFNTISNIWRTPWKVSPFPTVRGSTSSTDFPMGWKERVTVWSKEIENCQYSKFMASRSHSLLMPPAILLLDPLPHVVDRDMATDGEERKKTIGIVRTDKPSSRVLPHTRDVDNGTVSSRRSRREAHSQATSQDTSLPPNSVPLPDSPSNSNVSDSTTSQSHSNQSDALQSRRLERQKLSSLEELTRHPTKRRSDIESGLVRSVNLRRQRTVDSIVEVEPAAVDDDSSRVVIPEFYGSMHGPFAPFHQVAARVPTLITDDDLLSADEISGLITLLRNPESTFREVGIYTGMRFPSDLHVEPLSLLFRVIHSDTVGILEAIRTALNTIRDSRTDDAQIQQHVLYWRSMLNQYEGNLTKMRQQLEEFSRLIYLGSGKSRTDFEHYKDSIPKETQLLISDALHRMDDVISIADKAYDQLRAEMQIIDSRRSISEAESISKLTELAFVFIPMTFAASLFSMQLREIGDGVPAYAFVLASLGLLSVAYSVRLLIRSDRIIAFKQRCFREAREIAKLPDNAPVPTRAMLQWLWPRTLEILMSILTRIKRALSTVTSLLIVLVAICALLSPIVTLWQRRMNPGFSAVITLLMLILDGVLVTPIAMVLKDGMLTSGALKPQWLNIRVQLNRKQKGKKKKKERDSGRILGEPEHAGGQNDAGDDEDTPEDTPAGTEQPPSTASSVSQRHPYVRRPPPLPPAPAPTRMPNFENWIYDVGISTSSARLSQPRTSSSSDSMVISAPPPPPPAEHSRARLGHLPPPPPPPPPGHGRPRPRSSMAGAVYLSSAPLPSPSRR